MNNVPTIGPMLRRLRVFLASPGDVKSERVKVTEVIKSHQRTDWPGERNPAESVAVGSGYCNDRSTSTWMRLRS